MEITTAMQSKVLIHALPYIQKYANKTVVIKYGGNAMTDAQLKNDVMNDLVLLTLVGIKVVLVHGGGPEITDLLTRMGKESRFVGGLRYTDAETAEVAQMVLAGKINKSLVSLLQQHKGKAIGLCGIDGNMFQVKKHIAQEDLGFVGDVVSVNTHPIEMALENGYIPVISTIGAYEAGNIYNINADTAAAQIAAALGSENLIVMTDIKGLLRDKNDDSTLIPFVQVSEVPYLIRQGIISGGMIPKVECCVEAVRRGVKKAVIIDGRIPHSILVEIFSDEGIGTMFQ